MPSRNILLGSMSTGVTGACRTVPARRSVKTTCLSTLSRKDRTGSKGAPSALTISSPASKPAFSAGVPSITPVIMLPPDVPGRERMPMPG